MAALALKYRPKTFEDLVGQVHAAKSLKNAIDFKQINHAYLFFGSRGVGKTSMARILAKALNCINGPTSSPCGVCENCVEISKGEQVDVLEMDAASNRGIDNIKDLRENVRFAPMKSNYKIYIIDEVHMLTRESFNALLKTLEEPPSHVVFILATTEQHKIPETILSRCQSFAFKKFSHVEIGDRLKFILQSENIEFEDAAVNAVANKADGSMRDSISILDQVLAFSGKGLMSFDKTSSVLGLIPVELYTTFVKSFHEKDLKNILLVLDELSVEGYDLKSFLSELLQYLRDVLLIKHNIYKSENGLIPESNIESISEFTKLWGFQELQIIFDRLFSVYSNYSIFNTQKSNEVRMALELAIIETLYKLKQPSVSQVVQKLASLSKAIESGEPFVDTSTELKVETSKPSSAKTSKPKNETAPSSQADLSNIRQELSKESSGVEDAPDMDTLLKREFLGEAQGDKVKKIFEEEKQEK